MGLKSELSLAFALLLMMVFSLGIVLGYSSELTEEKLEDTSFHFTVLLRRIDWGTRSIETYIEIYVHALPYNLSSIEIHVKAWRGEGAVFHLYLSRDEPQYSYRGNVTTAFGLMGTTEFYPFDRYRLNITFTLPSFGLINENNTWLYPQCQEGGFEWPVPPGKKFSNITYEHGESANLNSIGFLSRGGSSTNLIMQVLVICYALVGSLPLIKPDRLEHRLSVCLSLFIFAVTFTYTIPIPPLTRATLTETLILILLTGAGVFSVASVVEKALIEARSNLAVCQYLIEGLVAFSLISSLNIAWISLTPPWYVEEFPWASLPPELFLTLSIALLYGYVSVTFIFLLNSIRKSKSKISKRIRAIRLFRRQRI